MSRTFEEILLGVPFWRPPYFLPPGGRPGPFFSVFIYDVCIKLNLLCENRFLL